MFFSLWWFRKNQFLLSLIENNIAIVALPSKAKPRLACPSFQKFFLLLFRISAVTPKLRLLYYYKASLKNPRTRTTTTRVIHMSLAFGRRQKEGKYQVLNWPFLPLFEATAPSQLNLIYTKEHSP